MKKSEKKSRRKFLRQASAGTLAVGAANIITSKTHGAPRVIQLESEPEPQRAIGPNDKIRIGLIGAGGMGHGDTETALRVKGVEFVAAADIYDGRLTHVKEVWGKDIFTTRDYREVLARTDIDAVIIATPDHWHQRMAIDAMNAGKDVYCEKPVVQKLEEGNALIEAQQRTKRIFQGGSQFSSSVIYQKAAELVAAGKIGTLNLVDSSLWRRGALSAWQYTIPADASPQNIDWDRFLGSAPKRPFEPIRLFRWRNYRDYGTGIGGDLFVHQFTGAHLVTGAKGPVRVVTTGGTRLWNDGRDVPDVLLGLFDYPAMNGRPAFNMNFRVSFADGGTEREGWGSWAYRFVGNDGVIELVNDALVVKRPPEAKTPPPPSGDFAEAVISQMRKEHFAKYPRRESEVTAVTEERYLPPDRYDERLDHFKNFFNAMRSRKSVYQDAAQAYRNAAPALLANVSYFERRVCEWDPETLKLKA